MVAWTVLLALGAYQAYAHRYAIGPDGMSYLDLSDAVTSGNWRGLLDLYWSPFYPALIGVGRLLSGAGPRTEISVIHAVNFVGFAALLAAFEYLLRAMLVMASRVRGSMLRGPWALAGAYAFFGVLALTMLPLELTTPDLFSDAAILLAFGALLRLRDSTEHSTRHAIVLGLSLGLGALTKSFLVPWGVVCIATLAFVAGRRGKRELAITTSLWLLLLVPWTAALSSKAGHLTFGDAGRLTYAWYVNLQNPPSMGGVPPGARRPATEAILQGVGVPGPSPQADPMWADPERFNRAIAPHLSVSDQVKTLKVFHIFYVENFAPLMMLILLIATAPRGTRRASLTLGWPVYVPAAAGLFAYAMVLVTTRYVMPFVLAIVLIIAATIPLARRFVPLYALFGLALALGLEALLPDTVVGLALVTSMAGALFAAVLVSSERAAIWMVVTAIALFATRVVFPPIFPALLHVGAFGIAVLFWRASLAAVRSHRTVWFARRTHHALALVLVLVLGLRVWLRLEDQDGKALRRSLAPSWGNAQWKIAQDLASHGIGPETRIAVIGPHADSYWARTGRLHIVANVPTNRVLAFWALPPAAQDSLLAQFRAAGATVAIATVGPPGRVLDSTWTPVTYDGWIRPLR